MSFNIRSFLPPKGWKDAGRLLRGVVAIAVTCVSIHHFSMAIEVALHASLSADEMSAAQQLSANMRDGGSIGDLLTNGVWSLKIGIGAFVRYYWTNPLVAVIALVALYEVSWHIRRATGRFKRWRRLRKGKTAV